MPRGFEGVRHAIGRAGNHDPIERLKDMDQDGVDVEVCYCEFSAFRYLYLIKSGWREATQAFNDTLVRVRVGRPEAAHRVVPDPDPRHRDRGRRGAPRRRASAASRCSCPSTRSSSVRPTTTTATYDPLWAAIQETGLPGVLPHRPRADHVLQGRAAAVRAGHASSRCPACSRRCSTATSS